MTRQEPRSEEGSLVFVWVLLLTRADLTASQGSQLHS